jgi:hypothetical protein
MYQNFKDILSEFHAHGVKYLVVGGYAVIFHAQPRSTKDIDLLIQTNSANAHAIYAALAEFGLPLGDVREEDFAEKGSFFRFGYEPQTVDILPEVPGVAWERRVTGVVDPDTGLIAFFISAEDLIASKLASGRAQDLADVEAIRKSIAAKRKQN